MGIQTERKQSHLADALISVMNKLKLKEVMSLAQGLTAHW